MTAMMERRPSPADEELSAILPKGLPQIELYHGQAVWVMTELGFRGAVSDRTFYEYLKSLRKFGIPFEHSSGDATRRELVLYSYFNLMEEALALTLRVYHVVPNALLSEVIRYRQSLYRHYRRAYLHRLSGKGSLITVQSTGGPTIQMRGLFLDLQINYSGGHLVSFGPPKILSPYAAVATFAEHDLATRALLPINLSLLAERVVALSLRAPPVHRGPRQVERTGTP